MNNLFINITINLTENIHVQRKAKHFVIIYASTVQSHAIPMVHFINYYTVKLL